MDSPNQPSPPLRILDVLAEPSRRLLLWQLHEQPRTVSELCELTGLAQPSVSKHLRVLRRVGAVGVSRSRHDGRVRVYELRWRPFLELEAWLRKLRGTHYGGAPYDPVWDRPTDPDSRAEYTTRGTPRIRRRYHWRKADAEEEERALAEGDEEWIERQTEKLTRQARIDLALIRRQRPR